MSSEIEYQDGGDQGSRQPSFFRYSSVFDNLFPDYLVMGMTYEQYWRGDPYLVKSYRKADKMRRERMNEDMWLQGFYFYTALLNVSPMLNLFDKNRKPMDYMSEPVDLFKPSENIVKERNKKIQQKGIENMKAWAAGINAKKKQKGEK